MQKSHLNQFNFNYTFNPNQEKLLDEEGQQQNSNNNNSNKNQNDNYDLSRSANPSTVLIHISFKIAAVVSYFFLGILTGSTLKFIVITLLLAFDFWAVKNVTGRILVGLKWGSQFNAEGEQVWYFESHDHEFKANVVDKSFFWTGMFSFTVFWLVFAFLNLMGLDIYNLCLNGVGVVLSGINAYGYYKCSKEHQNKMKNLKNTAAKEGLKYMLKNQK